MDEYISKQKVLDYLNGYLHSLGDGGADTLLFDRMFDRGQRRALINSIQDILAVKAADVQPVNQWISVDDKLPEWDKTVLVWYASDTLFGVSEGYGLSWYHGGWRVNDLNGENIRIFYWQYLPEKPKDGDTNG